MFPKCLNPNYGEMHNVYHQIQVKFAFITHVRFSTNRTIFKKKKGIYVKNHFWTVSQKVFMKKKKKKKKKKKNTVFQMVVLLDSRSKYSELVLTTFSAKPLAKHGRK